MNRRLGAPAVLLTLCFGGLITAAQEASDSVASTASKEREQVLGHIRALAGRIEGINGDQARLTGLSLFGEIVCKEDFELAQNSFRKAVAIVERLEAAPKPVTPPDPSGLPPQANRAWAALLQRVARCDAQLAMEFRKQRQENSGEPSFSEADLRVARRLIGEDTDAAREFAERGLEAVMTEETASSLFYILYGFRQQNPVIADALFLRAVANLQAQLRADSYSYMLVGNYLFAPPSPPEYANTITGLVSISGVNVPYLVANRPWTTAALARPYIEAGISILSRPILEPLRIRQDYAAAYQLRPKAQEFAPGLVPAIDALMQRLSSQVPQGMAEGTAMARLAETRISTVDEQVEKYEQTPEIERRPEVLLQLLSRLWLRKDFSRARDLAKSVSDVGAKDKMLAVLDFGEALQTVERGELTEAAQAASKWQDRLKRSLVLGAVAAAYVEKNAKTAAGDAFRDAVREAQFVEPRLRSALLLALAEAQAGVDEEASLETLRQSVAANNEISDEERAWSPHVTTGPRVLPLGPAPPTVRNPRIVAGQSGFNELLEVSTGRAVFPLQAKGLRAFEFSPVLLKRFGARPADAEAAVSALANEDVRAQALACVAAAYLESLTVGQSTVQQE